MWRWWFSRQCSGTGRGDRIVGGRQCMRSGRRRDGAGEGIRDSVLWWIQTFPLTRDHGSSALNRDPALGFWKSSSGGCPERCLRVCWWRQRVRSGRRKENQKKNRDEGVISCSLRKWVSKGRWWFHPWVWRLWSSENGCLMTLSHFFNEEFKKTPPSLVVGVVASFYTDIRSH